ncbi:MAG TPA: hypothetical protein VD997_11530 [Phycisphaerales bacterium]|nr:hypothetical protein [Phycisphaerales bacterium]
MKTAAVALTALALLAGCANSRQASSQSGDRIVKAASPAQQQALLGRVKALEGKWQQRNEDGSTELATVYQVSSGGNVVREVMFPGASHEMTNVYHMDGPDLVMTHYCAVGNQPRMRAKGVNGNRIDFVFDSATNHTSPQQSVMHEMSLEIKDNNTIVQHWRSRKDGKPLPETKFELTRMK